MSAATRLPTTASILTAGVTILAAARISTVREGVDKYMGRNGIKNIWRILALIFAIVNFKNLPGVWHLRVIRGILYQLHFQPSIQKPKHLFAPLITSSYNTLYDCDYNFHKSNSTYFTDLDVARANFVGCLIRTGLARLNRGDEEGLPQDTASTKGTYVVALGGVSCFFHRQIEPLQSFEIYTRLLAWDRKWIYLVSHIVKKGVIKPESYTLQPWKQSKRISGEAKVDEEEMKKHIFATSVARYVFKKGRLTINPEIVLERSRLLPARPEGVGLPPRSESVLPTPAVSATPALNGSAVSPDAIAAAVSSKLGGSESHSPAQDDDWTWDRMEEERLRGLKIASHFDALSAAHGELRADEVLGEYGDYW